MVIFFHIFLTEPFFVPFYRAKFIFDFVCDTSILFFCYSLPILPNMHACLTVFRFVDYIHRLKTACAVSPYWGRMLAKIAGRFKYRTEKSAVTMRTWPKERLTWNIFPRWLHKGVNCCLHVLALQRFSISGSVSSCWAPIGMAWSVFLLQFHHGVKNRLHLNSSHRRYISAKGCKGLFTPSLFLSLFHKCLYINIKTSIKT